MTGCRCSGAKVSLAGHKVCLSRQNVCGNKIMFVATKYLSQQTHVCCNKGFVSTNILLSRQKTCFVTRNTCLSRQKNACCDKTFVATKLCLSRQIFVVTKFCRDEHVFVATKVLSRHAYCLADFLIDFFNP